MRHLHLRKRKARHTEPYPSTRFWMRLLDSVVLTAGVIGPLMTLPQIILIYSSHSAGDISLITWLGWTALDIPWLVYGIAHRELPIALTYSLWMVMNGLVVIGVILYS